MLLCCLAASAAGAEVWTEFEEGLGRMAARDMVLRHGEITDPLLVDWVQGIGERIAAGSSRQKLRFRFRILAADEDNAFSLPGGIIFVTQGLLAGLHSEDELAGVLAHELAHTENRDFARHLRLQLAFLGLQSLLRRHTTDTVVVASQFLQVYETLRRSRKHEYQADVVGADLAFAAQYDPEALLEFLRTTGDPRSRLDRLLATHPPGSQRLQVTGAHAYRLQTSDYFGLLALADHLAQRGYLQRALSKYELAARTFPQQSEPLLAIAALEERRDRPLAARSAYLRAQQVAPEAPEPAAALQRLTREVYPPLVTVALPTDLRAEVTALRARIGAGTEGRGPALDALRRGALAYQRDHQINRALLVAQFIAPETNDKAYLGALSQAYLLLSQATSTHQALIEVAYRTGSLQELAREVLDQASGGSKVPAPAAANDIMLAECARGALSAITTAEADSQQALLAAANAYRPLLRGARLVAGALLTLAASGPNQPLGRLNYSRFLLVQGDLLLAERNLTEAWQASQQALQQTTRRRLELLSLSVSALAARTGGPQARLMHQLAARRVGLTGEQLAAQTQGRLLGEVLSDQLALIPNPSPAATGAADRSATFDLVLRLIRQDLTGERIAPQRITRGDEP